MSPLAARAVGGFARTASGFFVVLGTLGLVRGHFDGFTSHHGVRLFSLTASPLTYVVLLAAGLVGIALALRLESARSYALWVGAIGVPWGLLEFVLGDTSADIFGRNTRLAWLTTGIGVVGLAVWAWSRPARRDPDLELPVG